VDLIFEPFYDDINLSGCYYKAAFPKEGSKQHIMLLYNVGVFSDKEPKIRWLLIDLIQDINEETGHTIDTIIVGNGVYPSFLHVKDYVSEFYNCTAKFALYPISGV